MKKSSIAAFIIIAVFLITSFIATVSNASQNTQPEAEEVLNDGISSIPAETPPLVQPPENTSAPEPDESDSEMQPGDIGNSDEPDEPLLQWPPPFEPYAVEETIPERMLSLSEVMVDGRAVSEYQSSEVIDFDSGDNYSQIEGVTTFRGNNFRDTAAFGTASITDAHLQRIWARDSGSLTAPDGVAWSGHGWTGQPLIAKWPKQTREIMNMNDWAKSQDELIEVIYPAMDGFIYFTELETGKPTRSRVNIGFTFKGSGAIDPRGYPLLYVGAGYDSSKGAARIFVISLIDGSVLYTFGNNDRFALRSWWAADAAALVDAETDTLIYPSESGILYIIKLNSVFDRESGTITINPNEPVKWRYNGHRTRSGSARGFWLGFEDSAVIWRGHLIIADNGGHLICLDMNTLEPVWVQDVLDDTNCSPVLELEDGHPYIYISTSFHGGWRAPTGSTAEVPVWKIDAVTGEIVWKTDYDCYTVSGVSGGVQGTIALGMHSLENLVFVPVARTPSRNAGVLAALDKQTGEIVWEFEARSYSWSSPVCVYNDDGKGYVIYPTANGTLYLLDGLTGTQLDSISLGGTIEASPVVYESIMVIGTRSSNFFGIKLT